MGVVTDEQIAAYNDACIAIARRLVGRNGAELDDLVQEGLVFVWQSLQRGIHPSADLIRGRMVNYVKWLGRKDPVPYEAMLPLDDYSEAQMLDLTSPLSG